MLRRMEGRSVSVSTRSGIRTRAGSGVSAIPCSGATAGVGSRRRKAAVAAAETAVASKATAAVATTRRCMPTSMLRKQRQREGQREERREGTEATHIALL